MNEEIDMPLIYVAAPFTAHDDRRTDLNVQVAKHMGCLIAELGCSPLMPTVNSNGFQYLSTQDSIEFWLEATAKQLERCDAIIFCQGWHNSTGCKQEMIQAQEMGIPIFMDIRALEEWYKDVGEKHG